MVIKFAFSFATGATGAGVAAATGAAAFAAGTGAAVDALFWVAATCWFAGVLTWFGSCSPACCFWL